jgi:hypothetical protein
VTTIVTRRSGCGCLTILAAVVVFVLPAGFGAWAVPAYIFLGVLVVLAGAGWLVQNTGRGPKPRVPQPPAAPPPV